LPTEEPEEEEEEQVQEEPKKVQYATINRNPEQNEVLPEAAPPSR